MGNLKRKGFTLIELLAVIVILAIIALIAVPVVMNIIDKANKSAFKDSAYGIIKAGDLYYSEQQMSLNGVEEDEIFEFPNNIGALQLNGNLPQGTMVVTKTGNIALAITNGKYCITKNYDEEDIKLSENTSRCAIQYTLAAVATTSEELGITKVDECIKRGTLCKFGAGVEEPTTFAIQVNDTDTYKFYVINDDGKEVAMLMDRNLGEKVAWYKDNDDTTNKETNSLGPITALNYLNEQTSNWDNIPTIRSYTYDNNLNGTNQHGYQKLQIENGLGNLTSQDGKTITEITGVSRVRLLTEKEMAALNGCSTTNYSCPSWSHQYLSDSNTTERPLGYWLLSANPINIKYGYTGNCYRNLSNGNVYNSASNGIRPVITLSK